MNLFYLKSRLIFVIFFVAAIFISSFFLLRFENLNMTRNIGFYDYLQTSTNTSTNNPNFETTISTEQDEQSTGNDSFIPPLPPVFPQRCDSNVGTYIPLSLNETFDEMVLKRHPNLPEFLIGSHRLSKMIPSLTQIRWSGTLYQESWENHPKCFLYSANFDSRLPTGLIVRILGSCEDKNILKEKVFCQFWYNETEDPVISPVYEADYPGPFTGKKLKTKMMSCKVPIQTGTKKMPIAVSLVRKPCTTPTNILKIGGSPYKKEERGKKDKKRNVTVGLCGKALYYYNTDFSIRLIEWIEILKLLGISNFFLYKTPCHENVEKVLNYYEKEGTVKILSFHYLSPFIQEGTFLRLWTKSNLGEFRAGQRIFYSDCILRNKDDYDYLAVFDYDEIPILGKHKTLPELMQYLRKSPQYKNVAAYGFKWKTFYTNLEPGSDESNISRNFHILSHNMRTTLDISMKDERNVKSIYDTNKVLYVTCHRTVNHKDVYPISAKLKTLSREIAYMAHYPERRCAEQCAERKIEQENALDQHRSLVIERVELVLRELNLKN